MPFRRIRLVMGRAHGSGISTTCYPSPAPVHGLLSGDNERLRLAMHCTGPTGAVRLHRTVAALHPWTQLLTQAPSPPHWRKQLPAPVQAQVADHTHVLLATARPASVSASVSAAVSWERWICLTAARAAFLRVFALPLPCFAGVKLYCVTCGGPLVHQNASTGKPACTSHTLGAISIGSVAAARHCGTPPHAG